MKTKRNHGAPVAVFLLNRNLHRGSKGALRRCAAVSLMFAGLILLTLLAAGCSSGRIIGTEDVTAPEVPSVMPQDRFVRDVTVSLPGKGYCAPPMSGVLVDLERDVAASETAQEALSQLYRCLMLLRDCGADTVFLRPDLSGRFASLTDENGAALDLTAAALAYAQAEDCYTVLTVDDRFLPQEETAELTALSGLLEAYDFDALLYAPESGVNDASYRRQLARLRAYLDGGIPVSFGCAISGDPTSVFFMTGADPLFTENTVDFVCVDPNAADISFDASLAAWNELAARYPDTVFYCTLTAENGASGESPARETGRRIELLYEQEQFRGVTFFASDLLRDASMLRMISEYCYREGSSSFAVRSMSFSEDGSAVVLGGNAVEGRKLTIDRTVISPQGGPFAVSCMLNEGPNRIVLRNAGYSQSFSIEKVSEGAVQATPTPYADHGLGRGLMCRIDSELTQRMDAVGFYDTFNPDYSDLPVGTLDYVTEIGFEDGVRYALASGGTVSAEDATLLSGAYILPANTVSFLSEEEDVEGRERLTFSSTWPVPVDLKVSSQPYRKGYFDFSYNIDDFSAEYLDVVFAHTAEIHLPESVSFGASSLFLRAEAVSLEGEGAALRLYLKKPSGYYGASLAWDQTGRLVLSLKKKPAEPATARVMLDPGHGGPYMTGTALNDDSLSEKDVTMDLARKVRDLLSAQGIEVRLTRESDCSVTLRRRKEICAAYDPDLFVSIHCDGVDDLGQSGTHSFYYKPFSQPLAACIHRRLVDVYATVIYSRFDRNYSQINKSIKYYPYYVTRTDVCPSVLVEAGFMSNDFEGRILADDNCRMWIADAMAKGIVDYLTG